MGALFQPPFDQTIRGLHIHMSTIIALLIVSPLILLIFFCLKNWNYYPTTIDCNKKVKYVYTTVTYNNKLQEDIIKKERV